MSQQEVASAEEKAAAASVRVFVLTC
jgi:hypothetical protein